MSEKIKELYDDASYSSYVRTDGNGNGNDHYRRSTDYELFAKSIIAECIKVVHDNSHDSSKIALAIEVHFGITEGE